MMQKPEIESPKSVNGEKSQFRGSHADSLLRWTSSKRKEVAIVEPE